ncbi:GGDEF domain-containing protein [bacterium]|nr:GGDEF domain-containing protein [bacterium]
MFFSARKKDLGQKDIENIIQKEIDKGIKRIKSTFQELEEKLLKKVHEEITKNIKTKMHDIQVTGEKTGIEAANKMLSEIKERVEKHVLKQIKKQVYQKVDVFEKDVTTLRSDKEQMEKLSVTDGLTRVYNRRYFESKIHEEFNIAKKFQTKLAIIFIDIDHFKSFNDTHGHQAGDEVLRQLSSVIDGVLRKNATLFRYGGEEFVILLSETDDKDAYFVAQRIRTVVEEHNFMFNNKPLKVTVSLGVASYPLHSLEIDEVLVKADKALYQAKNSGRNRVVKAE